MQQIFVSQTILIAVLTLLFTMVTKPTLLLAVECCYFALPSRYLVTPIAFMFLNLVTAVPRDLFKNARALFTNLFLTVVVKGMSSGLSQRG